MSIPSRQKITDTLGGLALRRLIERLRDRRDSGRLLVGTLILEHATPEERRAIDQLLRRPTTTGARLAVPLDQLLIRIQTASLADNWESILEILCGPPDTTKRIAADQARAWADLWERTRLQLPEDKPFLGQWLDHLKRDGLLKRLTSLQAEPAASPNGDDSPFIRIQRADTLLRQSLALLRELPAQGELLASLAARIAGHAHALDPDTPLSTLLFRAISAWHSVPMPKTSAQRRAHWELAGVACDELSAPVLVLNLRLGTDAPIGRLLDHASESGLPLHVSTMALIGIDWTTCRVPVRVFICENPAIVAAAARRHGKNCAPLICTDGEPKTAAWRLLHHLRANGATLCYHGDFDWGGVAIAGRIITRLGAKPWRFTTTDYLAGPKGKALAGDARPTPWDDSLSKTMDKCRYVIHEEAVADHLLADLAS